MQALLTCYIPSYIGQDSRPVFVVLFNSPRKNRGICQTVVSRNADLIGWTDEDVIL